MDLRLQYQLSNGSWVDCGNRTEEFLNHCVENKQRINGEWRAMTRDEILAALQAGRTLRNDPNDWYSECRCGNFHDEKMRQLDAQRAAVEMVKCSCGHSVPRGLVMNASMGTSCSECFDKMSY